MKTTFLKKFISRKCLAAAFALAVSCACAGAADSSIGYFDTIKSDPAPAEGKEYYMRHNIMYEKDEWVPTNYWRGTLVPVNTKVKLASLGPKTFIIEILDGGARVRIENNNYSKRSMAEVAKNMLAPNPVPVEKYGKKFLGDIKAGVPRLGMTKEQVIITRGYPPGHKTPSLDGSRWVYWSSRYVTYTFAFTGDVLTEGRGLN